MSGEYFTYLPEHELRQRVDTDERWWQDSVFLHWWDAQAGIGGAHRIGYEPNRDGGKVTSWRTVLSSDGTRFRRHEPDLPMVELDDGFVGGAQTITFTDPTGPRLRIEDAECKVDLRIENFYGPIDLFPTGTGTLSDDFAHRHLESSGRIVGTVELDGVRYDIDGLAHRDHSWGIRRWEDSVLDARWCAGSFGPDLSFSSLTWHGADDSIVGYGYLHRDGTLTYAESIDLTVSVETDGVSVRGGEVTWVLPDGERFTIRPQTVEGAIIEHQTFAWVDALSTVTTDDGRPGYCDMQVVMNPRGGRRPIGRAVHASLADGLDRRA